MEKENLNNVLGVEANSETTSKFVKTGRKFVSVQKHLSAFSVFMRVLIIIIWGGMMLSFLPQHYLAYQMAIGGLMYEKDVICDSIEFDIMLYVCSKE